MSVNCSAESLKININTKVNIISLKLKHSKPITYEHTVCARALTCMLHGGIRIENEYFDSGIIYIIGFIFALFISLGCADIQTTKLDAISLEGFGVAKKAHSDTSTSGHYICAHRR